MRIIILSPTNIIRQGGVERFVFYVHQGLAQAGYQVTILGQEDLAKWQRIMVAGAKKIGLEQPLLGFFLGTIAQKKEFDVCITNGMLGWNIKKAKVINVQHGTFARAAVRIDTNVFKYFFRRYIWGFFEGLSARRATVCVAVSRETKESVEYFYRAKNVRVIHNAVDTELFYPMIVQKKPQALFVGRFEYAKGKNILEPFQKYLRTNNSNLLIAENYSQEDLSKIYNESQVFVLPSLHEGCSFALLEAMACGTPFLASPVGMVPELQEHELFSECIVNIQTIDAYCLAYQNLVNKTNEEREVLSQKLRIYILENHTIERFHKQFQDLIHEISNL